MPTKVQKWGNSLGVRIPKPLAEQLGVSAGTPVEFLIRDGELVLRPVRLPVFTLPKLLSRVTHENRHREIDTGDPVGREVW